MEKDRPTRHKETKKKTKTKNETVRQAKTDDRMSEG